METENKDNQKGTEAAQEQKVTSTNKLMFFLWFIMEWRILIGIAILLWAIFGENGSQAMVTSNAWTGEPNAVYYPPQSKGTSVWIEIGFASCFLLYGTGKRIAKINERSS